MNKTTNIYKTILVFLFALMALTGNAFSQVAYTVTGLTKQISGPAGGTLDNATITVTFTLNSSGYPAPTTTASSSSIAYASSNISGNVALKAVLSGGASLSTNCISGTQLSITNNVVGADSFGLSCGTLLFHLDSATINVDNGSLLTAAPAPFSSTAVSGSLQTTLSGTTRVYSLTGTASATGGANPTVTGTPASWSPSAAAGSTTTLNQTLALNSSSAPVSFTSLSTTGGSWLTVSPTTGANTAGTGYTPAGSITISANPTGLAANTYNGSVVVNGPSGALATIPVTFTVTGPSLSLTASPSTLAFAWNTGTSAPASKSLTIDTSPTSTTTVNAAVTSGNSWLSVTPASGTTPKVFTVSVNTAGLTTTQTLNGTIQITGSGVSNSPLNVPVTFTVTESSLTVPTTPLTFNYTIGLSNPPSQNVSVSGTSGLPFTAAASTTSGGSWLSVTPTSGTVGTTNSLGISVNTTGLAAGTYNGSVVVTATASGSPATIPVTLTVSSATLTVPTTPLTFNYTLGLTSPPSQNVSVSGTSGLAFTAAASTTSGGSWLSVTPTSGTVGTTNSLGISVNTAGLAAGSYTGSVVVTASATGSPATIPVTLNVTAPTLTATPGTLNFAYQIGGTAPVAQAISVGGTAGVSFTAAVATGNAWLSVAPTSGTVPASINASVNIAGLAAGTYNGSITVSATGATTQTVNVQLVVSSQPTITAAPASMNFAYTIGAASPASQTLSLSSSSSSLAYTLASDQAWLSVTPNSGSTPGSASVSVNPAGLAAGNYAGTISVTSAGAGNSPQTVTVALTVTAPTLTATPGTLNFAYQIGGTAPVAQAISVGGTAGTAFTAAVATGNAWLSVAPTSGTVPASINASVNITGLAAGTYNGSITVSATGATTQTVNVQLVVSSQPTITAAPASMNFTYTIGASNPASQTLNLTSSGSALAYTLASNQSWLTVTPASGSTPGSGSVSVNPAGLAAGNYSGAISVTSAGAGNSPQTVTVALTVTAPTLTATPGTLNFAYQIGGTVPVAQAISVGGTAGTAFTAAVATGNAWLSVAPTSGTVPASINASVNITGLAAGTYNGSITVSATGATTQTVNVQLVVSSQPTITAAPASMNFTYTIGASNPASQTLNLTSSGSALAYTLASNQSWLTVTPASGSTPGSGSVSVNPAGLAAGNYSGAISVTSAGAGNSPQTVTVALTVTAPTLTATPGTLNFAYQIGGTAPVAQAISVGGTAGTAFTAAVATGNAWLSVAPTSGTVPASINASVNITGLAAGTYNGSITVSATGATTQTVTVQLVVSSQPTITAAPSNMSFTVQQGASAPAAQTLTLTGGSPSFNYTLASNQTWLLVTPSSGTTPGTASVSINPTGLAAGNYSGAVTVTAAGAGNSPVTVSVSLTVTAAAVTLTASPSSLTFNYRINGVVPAAQTISVGSGQTPASYTVAVSGGTWLSATSANGSTPGSITASINPAGLAAGTYGATITITSAGATNSPLSVPVQLVVTNAPAVKLSSNALSFSYRVGDPNPGAQTVTVTTDSDSVAVSTVVSGGNWLSVSSSSTATPATLSITVNPAGLAASVTPYTATVTVGTPTGSPTSQTIAVSLTVSSQPSISANPVSLTFTGPAGGAAPANQTISVSGTSAIAFAVSVAGAPWLSVTPATGTTPASLTAAVNTTGLAAGTYTANVTVTGTGANAITVPVTLTLSAAGPTIAGIRDGAGYSVDGFAPGSIISIFGTQLGPDPYVQFSLNAGGTLDNTLAGVKVTVDGVSAIPLLAYAGQVNAIMPFSAKISGQADVIVEYKGVKSAAFKIPMSATAIKLFAANAQGTGPAAALNQDFTVNSAGNPAAKGSVVQLFGAGGGAVAPSVVEGGVATANLSWVTAPYSATVNGVDAKVWYSGTAPGLVFGVYQINVQLPADVASGSAKIVVKIGNSQSQADITVFAQ